jgi:hypothetical protein
MKKLATMLSILALLPAGALLAAEQIQANAVRLGAGPSTGFFQAVLDRYTTPEEHARWREAFRTKGQDALVELWQKEEPSVGTMSFEKTLGYRIRAAYSFPKETGRHLLLVTDRPIAGVEAMRGTRSLDYPIGWIEIDVDAEGKGEGKLYGAVELSVENEKLTVKTYGTEPIRLLSVRIEEKK